MTIDLDQTLKTDVIPFMVNKIIENPGGSGIVVCMYMIGLGVFHDLMESMKDSLSKSKKHPHPFIEFRNGFRLYFRPGGYDGSALRGIHVKTFGIIFLHPGDGRVRTEFYRTVAPGCETKIFEL